MSDEHEQQHFQETARGPDPQAEMAVPQPLSAGPFTAGAGVTRPPGLSAATMLALQQTAGNAAVARIASSRSLGGISAPGARPSVELTAVVDESPVPHRPEHARVVATPPSLARVSVSVEGRPRESMVMRYQAGETGHGGVEEAALQRAGFSAGEASSVYVGNWLRDLSQLPKHPAVTLLIRILSLGEFNRDTSAEELGSYVPSEHLDDPRGSLDPSDPKSVGTVEDPEVRKDPEKLKAALAKLSPAQREAYQREEDQRAEITAAAKQSGLPEYIERGKFHAKEKFREAVGLKRTPDGMRAMGDGLHAIEDYYSHSNFTEACITMLKSEPAMKPLVARMAETQLGANPALLTPVDPVSGQIQIQSGTYSPGANDWVSRLELVQSEVETGQLTKAFVIGWMRMAGITGEDLGRRLGAEAGGGLGRGIGGVGGGVLGGVGGGLGGAASGAAAGFARGRGFFGTIGSTLGGLATGGAEGVVEGVQEGAQAGAEALGGAGETAGGAVAAYAGLSLGEIIGMVGLARVITLLAIPMAAIVAAAKSGLLEKIAQLEVEASAGQARARGLTGPTHSELSKDAPGNKLFNASAALAAAADEEIGRTMIAAWTATAASTDGAAASSAPASAGSAAAAASGAPAATAAPPAPAAADPALAAEQEKVAALVDKYVCHPSQQDWWQPIIRAEAAKASGGS